MSDCDACRDGDCPRCDIFTCSCGHLGIVRVHNHLPYRPVCNERLVGDQLRGACLDDDGGDR